MSEVKVNKITPRTDCGTTQLGDSGDTVTVTGDLRSLVSQELQLLLVQVVIL
jgi:hypothetical protein